jgi:hypothetical protein
MESYKMAESKRSFSPSGVPEKGDDYHGGCPFTRTTPDFRGKNTPSVNVDISFEEALKLSTAIQSALLRLNRYNRSHKSGRDMGMALSIKIDQGTIAVIEVPIKQPKPLAPKAQSGPTRLFWQSRRR